MARYVRGSTSQAGNRGRSGSLRSGSAVIASATASPTRLLHYSSSQQFVAAPQASKQFFTIMSIHRHSRKTQKYGNAVDDCCCFKFAGSLKLEATSKSKPRFEDRRTRCLDRKTHLPYQPHRTYLYQLSLADTEVQAKISVPHQATPFIARSNSLDPN